jgi:hypothetical protein
MAELMTKDSTAEQLEQTKKHVLIGSTFALAVIAGILSSGEPRPNAENKPEQPQAAPAFGKKQENMAHVPTKAINPPAPQPSLSEPPTSIAKAPQKISPPSPARSLVSSALPALVSTNNSTGEETYKLGKKQYVLDAATAQAFKKAQQKHKLPKELFVAACARESSCKPEAVNPHTKACGLFQLMPTHETQTLFRLLHVYGPAYGYGEQKDLVMRYAVNPKSANPIYHYKPRNDEANKKISRLCLNADFNTSMFAAEKKREIEDYERWLGNREITIGELTVMNNLGLNGLKKFVLQAWSDKKNGTNTMARAHFGENISRQNPSLVKHADTGKEKTVRESYSDIMNNFGGWRGTTEILAFNQQ